MNSQCYVFIRCHQTPAISPCPVALQAFSIPYKMFSRTVLLKRMGSCPTNPILDWRGQGRVKEWSWAICLWSSLISAGCMCIQFELLIRPLQTGLIFWVCDLQNGCWFLWFPTARAQHSGTAVEHHHNDLRGIMASQSWQAKQHLYHIRGVNIHWDLYFENLCKPSGIYNM